MSVWTAGPLQAADLSFELPEVAPSSWSYRFIEPPKAYSGEFGWRFWYGQGNTAKNLYDTTGTALVSRLTYSDMSLFAADAFTRFDLNNGWFLKGYAGGGGLGGGKLKDEDFGLLAPLLPYSATLSDQKDGSLIYGSVDLGYKVVRGPDFHVGIYAGYHFLRETTIAWGCTQIAVNPLICGDFPILDSVRVISQTNNWHSLRLGVDGAVDVTNRLKLSVDAAWLPYVRLQGADAHWLRIDPNTVGAFTGPVPEDGNGWGYQLEAVLSYRLTDAVSVGIGGRYWHAETKGNTHFEGHVVGFAALPQPVHWKLDNFGGFVQTSVKLGPYPLISSN